MSVEPAPLRPRQQRVAEEQWDALLRSGRLEMPRSLWRNVLLLLGATFFAAFTVAAIGVNVQPVLAGEESWHILLSPVMGFALVGFLLFGVFGIPMMIGILVLRPSLVLTREGYAEISGLRGRRRETYSVPWSAVEAVGFAEHPAPRWPLPPIRQVAVLLTPEAFARHTAGRRWGFRSYRWTEVRRWSGRGVELRSAGRGGSRVMLEVFSRAHRQFSGRP